MNFRMSIFAYDYKDLTGGLVLYLWNKLLVISETFESTCLL